VIFSTEEQTASRGSSRLERFRESDILRHVFESVVAACMAQGLVNGEGFAVDASVMEANASRYHGKAPDELGTGRRTASEAGGGRISDGRGGWAADGQAAPG
jgi:hypothetical protein